jgi:IS1 family transposase
MRNRLRIMASMKRLNSEQRARVLHSLMEGVSIRAAARLTGVSKTTILKLVEDAGAAAAWYQDRVLRNLSCVRIQADEQWGFVGCKQRNRGTVKNFQPGMGDAWLWSCICADTKLVVSFQIGERTAAEAYFLLQDLSERLDGRRFQLTTDGWRPYLTSIGMVFDPADVDFAQLQKQYGPSYEGTRGSAERRYSPAVCVGANKVPISGNPDPKHISTSYAERNNLNVRMHSRRMTRLTNAFSKKLANHRHAMALHFLYYNFVRIHQTLKMSPAMAAGVSKRLWEMKDVVDMLEAWEATQ